MDFLSTPFFRSTLLMLMLLNPFLVILYMLEAVRKMDKAAFTRALVTAGVISSAVFCVFAFLGDYVFNTIFQANFASFQIFGGIVFLFIGLQFVFKGADAIDVLRGELSAVAGAMAMPILIGPGTISASVLIGKRLEPAIAIAAIATAVGCSIVSIILLKMLHDRVKQRNERIIQRYTEVAGRIMAIYVGTISVEMIMQGLRTWLTGAGTP